MARLASGFWVAAYLRRLQAANLPAYVVSRGDDMAGVVFVKLATLDGQAQVFHRAYDFERDETLWREWLTGPEREVDEALGAERRRDPDLWVVEIEDRAGRTLLDEPGLA